MIDLKRVEQVKGTDRIVECVPNFSEGRSSEVVEALVATINDVLGAAVLGSHRDADHNRAVITFAGPPEAVEEAAVRVINRAAQLIDLREHRGVHPRVGAADVVPLVPVTGVTMKDCVRLAHRVGERVARDCGIPVYFYEHAALAPDRRHLEHVRRGGFEQLANELASAAPAFLPDLGPHRVHPSAGACIIGARPFLIAYNVNLQSSDLALARRIARVVRARDGGLPAVKALGLTLATRGIVQVSMNLIDYQVTSLMDVFRAVRQEAGAHGVEIEGSEIVGLVPQDALPDDAERQLKLENFSSDLILENRLREACLRKA